MSSAIDPVGVTIAGLNVVVAVVLLGVVASFLSKGLASGGAFVLLALVLAVLPLFVLPYRSFGR